MLLGVIEIICFCQDVAQNLMELARRESVPPSHSAIDRNTCCVRYPVQDVVESDTGGKINASHGLGHTEQTGSSSGDAPSLAQTRKQPLNAPKCEELSGASRVSEVYSPLALPLVYLDIGYALQDSPYLSKRDILETAGDRYKEVPDLRNFWLILDRFNPDQGFVTRVQVTLLSPLDTAIHHSLDRL